MRVLYLDLDTLRPDHLGCYGYPRATSPHIDSVAAQGMRFEQVYCSDAPCLPSRAALTTGQFGYHSGVVSHGGTGADLRLHGRSRDFATPLGRTSLPGLFRSAGLHTTYVGAFADRHSAWWYYAGFREIHDTGRGGLESAEEITPTALDWIERKADQDDWYLHVNYWDAHTPYRAPESFGNPFGGEALPTWITPEILERHRQMAGPHSAQDLNMYDNHTDPRFPRSPGELCSMDDVRALIDGYDTGIAYMDGHIGALFEALKAAGVFDDLVIIITADHGESLGELGIYAEHGTADPSTCRVPLIMRWPGRAGTGTVDGGLHYQLDLLPTLAELLHRPSAPHWDGVSFAPALAGEPSARGHLVLSQGAHVAQRSVLWQNWLYMRTYHDGYHLFPPELLYDLSRDPYLQADAAAQHPDLRTLGRAMLAGWEDEMQAGMPEGYTVDPLRAVLAEGGPFHARGSLKGYLRRLRESGRAGHADALEKRHPGEF